MQRNQTIEPTSRDSATPDQGRPGANGPQHPGLCVGAYTGSQGIDTCLTFPMVAWVSIKRSGNWIPFGSGAVSQCVQQHTLKYLLADQGQLKVCSDYISNIPGSVAYEHPVETRNQG